MTDQVSATTASPELSVRMWESLLKLLTSREKPKFPEGPWNGEYFPPVVHRSKTFSFEPLSPRVRVIDSAAYTSSIEHLYRALEWRFPGPDIDEEFSWIDMWSEWARFGRGDEFNFAALTHTRDREIGCAYLKPTDDSDDPYEAGLQTWVVEDALREDLDHGLLQEFLAWIDAEWPFDRVIYYTPESYQRGLEVATAAGLTRVDRKAPQPAYACFEWVRSSRRHS